MGGTTLLMTRVLQKWWDVTFKSRSQDTDFCPASLFSLFSSCVCLLWGSQLFWAALRRGPMAGCWPLPLRNCDPQPNRLWRNESTINHLSGLESRSTFSWILGWLQSWPTLTAALWQLKNPDELHPNACPTGTMRESSVTMQKVTNRVCRTPKQGSANFFWKGWTVNHFRCVEPMASVAATQLCCCSTKAVKDNI